MLADVDLHPVVQRTSETVGARHYAAAATGLHAGA